MLDRLSLVVALCSDRARCNCFDIVVLLLSHGHKPGLESGVSVAYSLDLFLDFIRNHASWVEVLKGDSGAVHGLEIANGGSVRASDKRLIVLVETVSDHGHIFLPEVVEYFLAVITWCLSLLTRGHVCLKGRHHILNIVTDGIDRVGFKRIFSVVTVSDAKHAKDGVALDHLVAIFFPQGC